MDIHMAVYGLNSKPIRRRKMDLCKIYMFSKWILIVFSSDVNRYLPKGCEKCAAIGGMSHKEESRSPLKVVTDIGNVAQCVNFWFNQIIHIPLY